MGSPTGGCPEQAGEGAGNAANKGMVRMKAAPPLFLFPTPLCSSATWRSGTQVPQRLMEKREKGEFFPPPFLSPSSSIHCPRWAGSTGMRRCRMKQGRRDGFLSPPNGAASPGPRAEHVSRSRGPQRETWYAFSPPLFLFSLSSQSPSAGRRQGQDWRRDSGKGRQVDKNPPPLPSFFFFLR